MLAVALRRIPAILADNAGYDSQTLVAALRAEHAANNHTAGLGKCCGPMTSVLSFFLFHVPRIHAVRRALYPLLKSKNRMGLDFHKSFCSFPSFATPHSLFLSDMEKGEVGNVRELGITESFLVKSSVIRSAAEAAEMILRVDDIVRSAPRQRDMDPRYN